MKPEEIVNRLEKLVREERRITNEILDLINRALEQRIYLELGYSSMFDWLVRGFGYSKSAAFRRIEAARLLKVVPEASIEIDKGSVNLTTLSKAQSMIRFQEKASGSKVSAETKREIVKQIENKSSEETEKFLVSLFPMTAQSVHMEKRQVVDSSETRFHLNLNNEAVEDLENLKSLLSHKFPQASDAEIIAHALKELVQRLNHATAKTSSAAELDKPVRRSISKAGQRRQLFQMGKGQCSYKNPRTGVVCGSRYQVQVDHIVPKAQGGGDEPSNLRLLCRQHNLLAAEINLGRNCMERFRSS